MLHKRSSLGGRKVSPPQPVCMTIEQKASYLADLRTNRPSRPTGSRPLPSRPLPNRDENLPPRAGSALSLRTPDEKTVEDVITLREQKLSHRASMPTSDALSSLRSHKGRPLVPSPGGETSLAQTRVFPPSAPLPDAEYRESSLRVKEREEAHALREALEKIDQGEDEKRIHDAAKLEAADLVWKHTNPQLAEVEKVAAYRNPDLDQRKYGEISHAKKDSQTSQKNSHTKRSTSAGSTASQGSKRNRLPWLKQRPKPETTVQQKQELPKEAVMPQTSRKTSARRMVSSGSSKGVFRDPEDEIFEEPQEMKVEVQSVPPRQLPLRSREHNSVLRGSRPLPEKSQTEPIPQISKINQVEIWTNTPTQSRNAGYTAGRALPPKPVEEPEQETTDSPGYKDGYEIRGDDIRAATSMRKSDRSPNLPTPTAVSDRPGRPIVSFDKNWRPGTESPRNSPQPEKQQDKNDGSMAYPVKPKPPVPEITIMEDPKSPALEKQNSTHSLRPGSNIPSISISIEEPPVPDQPSRPLPQINLPGNGDTAPTIPSINISMDEPTISGRPARSLPQFDQPDSRQSAPAVRLTNVEAGQPQSRLLPSINVQQNQVSGPPLPVHTQSSSKLPPRPTQSEMAHRVPWLSRTPTTSSTNSATCTACSLPISGRVVTASGSSTRAPKARFHPECFTCHHCSTSLECVSFYPEPQQSRLDRIAAFSASLDPQDPQVQTIANSNEDLRFFCHLDYHEIFSPRCHTCKTPIESAVILALGRHYHPEHFFCAECGDPFSSESPFVEHNRYAYCVSCHTKRTSARCRSCKSPILNEMTIEALGGKWHDDCFVCCDCGGDFGEEGRFFVREIQIELTEKEKRKGLPQKIEQRAACQGCEERRVKNVKGFL